MSETLGPVSNAGEASEDIWTPLRALVELSDSEYEIVRNKLKGKYRRRRDFETALVDAGLGLDRGQLRDAIGLASGFISGWLSFGKAGDKPVETQAAERIYPDSEQFKKQRARVEEILSSAPISFIALANNSSEASGQFVSRIYADVDLSPIGPDDNPGSALVANVKMAFEVMKPDGEDIAEMVTVSLTLSELERLRDIADDKLSRFKTLASTYEAMDIILWDTPKKWEASED